MSQVKIRSTKQKRAMAVRSKISGTPQRPRLTVYRSNKHILIQAIDDTKGVTLAAASDQGKEKTYKGTKTERAQGVAKDLAAKLKELKIKQLVFDRGSYRFHGRVKAIALTLKEQGIQI